MLNVLPSRYETGRSVGAPADLAPAAAADRPAAAGGEQLRRAVVAQLGNVSRHDGGLYVCTADNGVTAPVERVTRILVRREYTWYPAQMLIKQSVEFPSLTFLSCPYKCTSTNKTC